MGLPREIQEVKNAIACYDQLATFDPSSVSDFLKAHGLMMQALTDDAGSFRNGGVGIYRGSQLIHMAPPADRVPYLIDDLFAWFAITDLHPLISSSILHYEIEFIHPFSDGNGRMGRLWQSLALARWHPELAYLPVESVIRERQTAYYDALGAADCAAEATPFIEFILDAISESLDSRTKSDLASDPASDPVPFDRDLQNRRITLDSGDDGPLAVTASDVFPSHFSVSCACGEAVGNDCARDTASSCTTLPHRKPRLRAGGHKNFVKEGYES